MSPCKHFVLVGEKLHWIERSSTYANLQIFGLLFLNFVLFHRTI